MTNSNAEVTGTVLSRNTSGEICVGSASLPLIAVEQYISSNTTHRVPPLSISFCIFISYSFNESNHWETRGFADVRDPDRCDRVMGGQACDSAPMRGFETLSAILRNDTSYMVQYLAVDFL